MGSRFGVIIASLIIIATTLIAVLYERNQYSSALQQAEVTLENNARLLAERLNSQIDKMRRDLELLSDTPPIQGIIRSSKSAGVDPLDGSTTRMWLDRLGQIFTSAATKFHEYDQIRYIGIADEGREIVRVNRLGEQVRRVADDALQSKSHRDYFKETTFLNPGQVYLSEINLNRDFGRVTRPHTPTLRIAKPIFSRHTGELFGMLVLNRNLSPLFRLLERQLPVGVDFYLTNETGDYLYHPDPGKRFGFDLGQRHRLQDSYPSLAGLFDPGNREQAFKQDVRRGDQVQKLQFMRINFDPVDPTRYLGLALTIPHENILSLYEKNRVQNMLLIAALGVIAMLLTLLLLQRITRPLGNLASSAQQIARGQYDIEIPFTGTLELEMLAEALRHAANDVGERERALARLNGELEQRVQERTEALQQREQSLVDAQRIASLGSWEWDAVADCLSWSEEIYRIFGLDPRLSTPSYQLILEMFHPDDRERFAGQFLDAIKREPRFEVECRLLRPDGEERTVQASGEITRGEDGRALKVQGTMQDITERKQTENRLRLLASVFQNSLEGILITDPGMTILQVNPAFTQITGYSVEEAVGKTPRMLSSGWHDARFYQEMWRSLKETGQWQGEMTDRRKSGEIYTEWLTIIGVHDRNNQLVNYVGVFNDITEKKLAEERITHLAYYDPLTELANRRLFEDRLEQTLRLARRKNRSVALLYIDLDRFKPVNDSLGHKAGDLMLMQVARRLQECVRESDTVARLGGDEFAAVLEDIDQVPASHTAQTIIGRLGDVFNLEGSEAFIGASIGISMFPGDGADLNSLMKHADIAMYRAKELGRNNYQFFLPEMNAGAEERLYMEGALRYAIEREELELHYQPQVRLDDGKVIGVEALLRWHHPRLGSVSPVRFIPIAEESGLINRIGEWVLEQACIQRQSWEGMVDADFRVAVNLSARQFNSNVVSMVENVLQRTGISPGLLEIEITESMVMADADSAIALLKSLNGLGINLAVDDFGTGYSSLSYLKRFPLHKLKIDRAFISDLPDDEEDAAITRAVIAMARSLGLKVIAEGTETLEQIRFLRDQGCNEVQGYYCSRPLPAPELETLMRGRGCRLDLE
ncbi:MAG: EAL domain-containing protein [Sedimenticola sp.]|nr:EAL domain-containing protein [Sedimenticola sp.]